jgi:hypothetical protein
MGYFLNSLRSSTDPIVVDKNIAVRPNWNLQRDWESIGKAYTHYVVAYSETTQPVATPVTSLVIQFGKILADKDGAPHITYFGTFTRRPYIGSANADNRQLVLMEDSKQLYKPTYAADLAESFIYLFPEVTGKLSYDLGFTTSEQMSATIRFQLWMTTVVNSRGNKLLSPRDRRVCFPTKSVHRAAALTGQSIPTPAGTRLLARGIDGESARQATI